MGCTASAVKKAQDQASNKNLAHDSAFCVTDHTAEECGDARCKEREYCVAGCTGCPDFVKAWKGITNTRCKGNHAVDGENGCGNEACRDTDKCLGDCVTCPDFVKATNSVHCVTDHTAAECGDVRCKDREYCAAGCTGCPDFRKEWDGMKNKRCKGEHPVDGADGCNHEACRGLDYCLPDCVTCPDFAKNTFCKGEHDVDNGCRNEECRGIDYCKQDCFDCPDFIAANQ